ncbi:MAG TPA: hypothetical protein VF988_11065, partial [Verrucomicrobiae bacterium]
IAAFRAELVVYLAAMRPALEEVTSEVLRTRMWLQDDRRRFWEQTFRKRSRQLEDAKQELFTASLSRLGEATSVQQMAVQRAQRALRETEEKLSVIKKWDQQLDDRTGPPVKQIEQLHSFLTVEMTKAVAYLDQVLRALEAYKNVAPPPPSNPSPTP